jgi:hypothetical protein
MAVMRPWRERNQIPHPGGPAVAKQKFDTSFNFGANAKPKKRQRKAKKSGGKSNAWTAYVGGTKRR